MKQSVNLNFEKARTNVEDGAIAVRRQEMSNANHFGEKALDALDTVPEELPYIRLYRSAVEEHNFETALDELANFAAYIREYDGDEYNFKYSSEALDRVEESAQ